VREGDEVVYRPTVHYAYHPCDDAVLSLHGLAGKNCAEQTKKRLVVDEITEGIDELRVLLCGHAKGAYWDGSQLEIENSRWLVEHNSATSLQLTATAFAGVIWVRLLGHAVVCLFARSLACTALAGVIYVCWVVCLFACLLGGLLAWCFVCSLASLHGDRGRHLGAFARGPSWLL
jgi:hypothetical protein